MALTAQQQAIQNQINAFDSNTGTQILLSTLLQAINAGDVRQGYADSAAFPTDSAFIGMIGFDDFDSSLRYVGRDLVAHKIDSADIVSAGGGGASLPAVDMRGTSFGYHMSGTAANMNKYSFVSDGNATDLGNYSLAVGPITDATVEAGTPGQSATAGYIFNHYGDGYSPAVSPAAWTRKDAVKYPYATDAVSQTTATMLTAPPGLGLYRGTRDAVGNRTYAYQFGGNDYATSPSSAAWQNIIGKFATATDANATDVGDLAATAGRQSGASSSTHGYVSGGYNQSYSYTIEKVDFASDGNSTSVGNLASGPGPVRTMAQGSGGQSDTHGYVTGGISPPTPTLPTRFREINKFPFASDSPSTHLGNQLATGRYDHNSTSSSTHIYSAGGLTPSATNEIEKFTVASDTGGTDVGDLNAATNSSTGSGI